jgi:DNA-binding transcriptional LysR family regulator
MLADGELDLCVTTTPDLPSAELPSRTLYEERYVCVVRSAHPLKARTAVTLEQFCCFPHVMVSPTEGRFVGPTDRALAQAGRRRRVVVSAPGFLILPEILQTEDLIAVVPERVLRGRMAGLRTFAPPVPVPGFSVILLRHQRQCGRGECRHSKHADRRTLDRGGFRFRTRCKDNASGSDPNYYVPTAR